MRILLVEDDTVTLTACETFLRRLGHDPVCAQDGDLAWTLLQEEGFPVIISDWRLPGKSGIELCARLCASTTKDYPYFILITSFQGAARMKEAMDAGVDDFLPKPIDLGTLAARLRVGGRILEFNRRIEILEKLLPICSYCKRIRVAGDRWQPVETYFKSRTGTDFSHSICPSCYQERVVPQLKEMGYREL